MRLLHAIHDFLPRHRAGSEIYACELARELSRRHDVFILAAEYDPATPHGTLRWRRHDDLTVVELVNNWEFDGLEESYSSPRLNAQLQHVLDATRPDVLHIHNLLNLSFDLPRLAHERGIATLATLHDYTLVCASGGQRVHVAEAHVCEVIDPERCGRCFTQSALAGQMAAGRITRRPGGRRLAQAAAYGRRLMPVVATSVAGRLDRPEVGAGDIRRRLAYARQVFDTVDLFVSPSKSVADEFERLGLDKARLEIADYGFSHAGGSPRPNGASKSGLRIGFVGTLAWHKGAHMLLEAARLLSGAFEVHLHGDTATFPDYTNRLRAMARGLPVTFHGRFEHTCIGDVYTALDALVVPSLWLENSPLVIHEAFMHGVPVIGARIGGIPGLLKDGVGGILYDAFSPQSLAAALQPLIDAPALGRRLAESAPAVKTIAEDAVQWEARYARVRHAGQSVASPTVR